MASTISRSYSLLLFVWGFITTKVYGVQNLNNIAELCAKAHQVPCLEEKRFYRNPRRPIHKTWAIEECSKYYLCLLGEVFEFTCSPGLLFDVEKQICDLRHKIDNCDVTTERSVKESDSNATSCSYQEKACNDTTCLPKSYFCDGNFDCPDESDETSCAQQKESFAAPICNLSYCKLPDCFCSSSGTSVPENLQPKQIPQMVILTFDGAINDNNWRFYKELFSNQRVNPDGCPIKATFFVEHELNDYQKTETLWTMGHEIALNSITKRAPESWWSEEATIEDWFDEMVGQANILSHFAGINLTQIMGLRAPFLKAGWNRQFLMMKEFGFLYDNSLIAPSTDRPLWPYTLNYRIPHVCAERKQKCPTRSYPGIWALPLNPLQTLNSTCILENECFQNFSAEDVFQVLNYNFKRHYLTNRAPYGLHVNQKWLKNQNFVTGFLDFMETISSRDDVWIVSCKQVIEWIKQPTTLLELDEGASPWACEKIPKKVCTTPNVCNLKDKSTRNEKILITCNTCPNTYPGFKNEFGV